MQDTKGLTGQVSIHQATKYIRWGGDGNPLNLTTEKLFIWQNLVLLISGLSCTEVTTTQAGGPLPAWYHMFPKIEWRRGGTKMFSEILTQVKSKQSMF